MRSPVRRARGRRARAAPAGGRRPSATASSTGSTSFRTSAGFRGSASTGRGSAPPTGPTPADADPQAVALGRQTATFATAYECACRRRSDSQPHVRSMRSTSISSTRRPERSPARKSSTGSVRSPPAPVERTRAPSAISGAPRSPRWAPRPGGAQRLPPTVAVPRTSSSAIVRATARRAGRRCPSASAASGTIAPIRIDVASTSSPSRPAAVEQHRARRACTRPAASSGMRIVPPPKTVTPSPSPNNDTASSADVGNRAPRPQSPCGDSTRSARAHRGRACPRTAIDYAHAMTFAVDRRARVGARRRLVPRRPRARDRALSCRCSSRSRCCSRARRASGRPRPRRRSPRRSMPA